MRRLSVAAAFVLSFIVGVFCFAASPGQAGDLSSKQLVTTVPLDTTVTSVITTVSSTLDSTVSTLVGTATTAGSTVTTAQSTVTTAGSTVSSVVSTASSVVGTASTLLQSVPATVPGGGITTDGLFTCAHYLTQKAAQAALDANPLEAPLLDPDGNGSACELLPSGAATVPGGGSGSTTGAGSGGTTGGATTAGGSADVAGAGGAGTDVGSGGAGAGRAAGQNPTLAAAQAAERTAAGPLGDKQNNAPVIALAIALLATVVGATAVAWRAGWFDLEAAPVA